MQLRRAKQRKDNSKSSTASLANKSIDISSIHTDTTAASWKPCVDRAQSLEKSFCQNFYCCGTVLQSLHDLLEHFEESHVRLEGEDDASLLPGIGAFNAPQIPSPSERFNSMDALNPFKKRSFEDMYSSSSHVNYIDDQYSAFNDAIVSKKHKTNETTSDFVVGFDEDQNCAGSHQHQQQQQQFFDAFTGNTDDECASSQIFGAHSPQFTYTVAPSLLSSSEDDEQLELEMDPEYAYLKYMKSLKKKERISSNVDDAEKKDRKYTCLVPGCTKVYRNQNGLKYHVEHSHTAAEQELCERLTRAIKEDPIEKPFGCTVPGCSKRYRNSNGLKYHMLHHH